MIKTLLLCLNLISCQAGCEDGANPGPNGYQYIGSQFEYVSEVVEQKLSLDGSFDEFRFAIKFQSTTRGSEYALTINPEYEPVTGIKDVVLLEMKLDDDRQVWRVENGLIKNLATEHTLGVLESGNIGGFMSATPLRNFMWHFDGYCLRSEDNGMVIAFASDLASKLGKSVKLLNPSEENINSTIYRLNTPPAQPKAVRKSYIQHASIEYQVATLNKLYEPTQFDSYIYYYNERQFSQWDADRCTTTVILESDLQFGLENVKIGSSVKPYPLPPKHYFRYGRDFNTSWERTEPFDEFETCYFDTYNDLEENQFQKLIPYQRGWLTPSGGVFVERQPTREYKDKFGRTMVEESFEYFIDYDDDMISERKPDIPSLTECDRKFTHEIISERKPDAFTVQLEHIDPKYKFITAAELTRSNQLQTTRIRTFPNDFQVTMYKDHFPFGKRDYVTIIDENIEIVYITTTEAQCQIMTLDDYKSSGIDYSRVLAVTGQYYGPTYSRDLPSKRAFSRRDDVNEEWAISKKVLYDNKTDLDFELPIEYRFKSGDDQFNVNIYDQQNVPDQLLDVFSPLACYDADRVELAEMNLTHVSDNYSPNALLAATRHQIAVTTMIRSEMRITNLHLLSSEQDLVVRFMFLPSLTDSMGQSIDIATDEAMATLNKTLNSNKFAVTGSGL